MAEVKEYALANIARVDIITEEEDPKSYILKDIASEAEVLAYVSEGEEKPLRVKNTIKAQNNTEDIVMGYDLKFIYATLVPEVLALVDGGTWDPEKKKYKAAPIGMPVEKTSFTTHVYTEDKDGNGDTKGYIRFIYKHCKGKPVNYSLQDGEFFVPELSMRSRPKLMKSPVEFDIVDELPDEPYIEVEPETLKARASQPKTDKE